MGQGGELGALLLVWRGRCGVGALLDCALGWAAGLVLGPGVAGALGLGELLGPLAGDGLGPPCEPWW